MIMNSGWNNLAWCSEHVSYHKYQLKYFYKSQQDTCTWKHSSLFTMLYYCAWFQIFEFVDHKFSWIRFFCLRLLSTNSRISVYHVKKCLFNKSPKIDAHQWEWNPSKWVTEYWPDLLCFSCSTSAFSCCSSAWSFVIESWSTVWSEINNRLSTADL